MATLEQELKQARFDSEVLKANINLLFTANWLYNKISAHLKPYQLTHEQFNVLRILRGSHPNSLCQKDILSRMIAPNSNVTLIVKKLTAKDLIRVLQSETDKREYQINITAKGLRLLQAIQTQLEQRQEPMSPLSNAEAAQLNRLLEKLRSG